jgi:hypothetical protein
MRQVEDMLSGIPEDPTSPTAGTDGRMYPPDDRFEVDSGSGHVRTFKQLRHRTAFGDNGAIRITLSDGTIEIDLPGADGRLISDLLGDKQ